MSEEGKAALRELLRGMFSVKSSDMSALKDVHDEVRQIEIDGPLTDYEYRKLASFIKDYPDATLWVRDHDGLNSDFSFLKYFNGLKRLRLHCFWMKQWENLDALPESLEWLRVHDTNWRNVSLSFLRRLLNLTTLIVAGHHRDIVCVSTLRNLEYLGLRSVKTNDYSFAHNLDNLRSLHIQLTGAREMGSLSMMKQLTYLNLWMIRGLDNIGFIAGMTTLEHLHLESLKNVTEIPDLSGLKNLKKMTIQNMKGVRDLSPLNSAKSLETLEVWDSRHMKPEDFAVLVKHPSLVQFSAGLGSDRKNEAARAILKLQQSTE